MIDDIMGLTPCDISIIFLITTALEFILFL